MNKSSYRKLYEEERTDIETEISSILAFLLVACYAISYISIFYDFFLIGVIFIFLSLFILQALGILEYQVNIRLIENIKKNIGKKK